MPSPRCTLVLVCFLSLGNFKKNPLALKAVSLRHKSEAEKTQRRAWAGRGSDSLGGLGSCARRDNPRVAGPGHGCRR